MRGIDRNMGRSKAPVDKARTELATHLLLRSALADPSAFSKLYRMTHGKLRSVAAKVVKDRSDVEDILQDSYLKIWNKARQYDPEISSPITWMSRIVTNTALDAIRRVCPHSFVELDVEAEEIVDTASSSHDRLETDEQMRALIAAIKTLPPRRRELVELAYFRGDSREALAKKFGTPASTVKTWLRRTLISVREIVETDSGPLTRRKLLVARV